MFMTYATQLILALVSPISNPGPILHEQELFYRPLRNHEGSGHVSNGEHEPIQTLDQLFPSLDRESSYPSSRTRAQPALVTLSPEV